MPQPEVSLCLIARNEERFLPHCLEAVRELADEIIVVDTGSEDATVAIAQQFGARVLHHPWRDDFAAARNHAMAAATGRWMLALDADERLDPAGVPLIREAIAGEDFESGFLHFVNVEDDGRRGREWLAPRLFRLRPGLKYIGRIHEQVVHPSFPIRTRAIEATVFHYGYQSSVYAQREKRERNRRLLEQALEDPEARDPLLRTNYLFHHANLAAGAELLCRYEAFAAYVRDTWAEDPPRVPWITGGLVEYARLLTDVGRYPEARDLAARLLRRHGESPLLRYFLARALAAENQFDEAERHIAAILSDPPKIADEHLQYTQDVPLVRGRARFLLGLIREKQGRVRDAADLYEQAAREEPEQALLQSHWACALVRLGRYREALAVLGGAASNPGADCLGFVLALITQSVGALAVWGERIRKLAPSYPPAARLIDRVTELGAAHRFELSDFPEVAAAVEPQPDPGRLRMPQTARRTPR